MSSAISRLLPAPRLREVDRVAVAAPPADAWSVVREADLYALRFVRALFDLRTLPERAGKLLRGERADPAPRRARLDDIVGETSSFRRLAEVPGREFVAGAIGKFWKVNIPFVEASPETFRAFAEPGFGKVAWSLEVHPRVGGGSWIVVDLRVDATSPDAWRAFLPYWALIGRFSRLIRRRLLRHFRERLGRPAPEADRELPGDELLPNAGVSRTHAVTIEAPPSLVWPWLVQMGCRRAGWYSVDLLDNGGAPSADRIVEELQHVEVGDILPATPESLDGFAVLRVDPDRALVLGSPSLLPEPPPATERWGMFGAKYDATWSFALEPIGDDATRLLVRVRGDMEESALAPAANAAILAVHEVMERAQLHNIKQRAESLAAVERAP